MNGYTASGRLRALLFAVLCKLFVCVPVAGQGFGLAQTEQATAQVSGQYSALLRANVQAAQQDLDRLGENITAVKEEISKLIEELSSLQPDTEQADDEQESGAKEVKYRPPLARRSSLETISFVCIDGHVIYTDFDALDQRRKELKPTDEFIRQLIQKSRGKEPSEFAISVQKGNFNLHFVYHVSAGKKFVFHHWRAVPKPGVGQQPEDLNKSESEFLAALLKTNPHSTAIQFFVFHDSFEAFRSARSIAWERGFEVGWSPFSAGQSLILVGGGGGSVQL